MDGLGDISPLPDQSVIANLSSLLELDLAVDDYASYAVRTDDSSSGAGASVATAVDQERKAHKHKKKDATKEPKDKGKEKEEKRKVNK